MNPPSQRNRDPRRAIPGVDRLVRGAMTQRSELPAWAATEAARHTVEELRARLAAADAAAPSEEELVRTVAARAAALARPRPARVVNATGVVLHTNLGRAVLAPAAADAAREAATGYSDLEFDLASGGRGNRLATVNALLAQLGGCEAGLAVNNNAAATMLALDTLARGREVVVSRGELVEIGGSFRVPDILERAGVRLVEVGTTNRTHPDDYRRAIGPDTALLLKVHRSNFELRGFTREVDLATLVAIGREAGVPVVEDLGSGSLIDLAALGIPPESHAPSRAATGVDCVCFSGDKLLGGPQAGLVLGRSEVVEAMRSNPLARALRLDKSSLAALDWTLRALLEGRASEIPTVRQLGESEQTLQRRAEALAERLRKLDAPELSIAVEPDRSAVGGGSLPGFELPTSVVALRDGRGADALATHLRRAQPPIVTRIRDDAVLLDVRTLLPGDDALIEAALRGARPEAAVGEGVV